MSLAGEVVDGFVAIILGGAKIDDDTRARAKADIKARLATAKEADLRELLGTRADVITEAHRDRVRKIAERHGLEPGTITRLEAPEAEDDGG